MSAAAPAESDLGLYPSVGQVASDSSILAMGTVLSCDVPVGALPEGGFLARASNFTQMDGTHALPHAGTAQSLSSTPEAQLPTHHTGCLQVPLAVTDCAPRASLQDFYPALSWVGSTL